MSIISQIVTNAVEAGSSDIHLEEGVEIAVRINSDIRISDQKLSAENFDEILLDKKRPGWQSNHLYIDSICNYIESSNNWEKVYE